MGRTAAALIAVLVLVGCSATVEAIRPTLYRMVDQSEFVPLIYEPAIRRPAPRRSEPAQSVQAESIPQSVSVQTTGSSIRGRASWYCRAGISICHYRYPPGSMVAAACKKLRVAMGRGWRGDTVTVKYRERAVQVKLVDWCGSTTKLIDLYWEPMRRLGGTGVLPVTVSWR